MAEENKAVGGEAAAEAPPDPAWLFYMISFLVPIAGIVLGALYLSKPDAPNKEFGKYCLVAALVNFGIGFSVVLCMVLFYAAFFAAYLGIIFGILGAAAGGGM